MEKGWGEPVVFGTEAGPDGPAIYLLLEAAEHPPEVWKFGEDFSKGQRCFSFNPVLARISVGEARLTKWRAFDGQERRGALLLPPGCTGERPLPLVVEVYGGLSMSDYLHRFGGPTGLFNGHLLTARGYAVLYPDMPMQGCDPMQQFPGLVIPAINHLVDAGIADPDRLGLMGHSYGGYCVLALLTQTALFKAAVCIGGISNLTSFYGVLERAGDSKWTGWLEHEGRMGGTLWDKRDSYIENSPLFYLDRVNTPLLLAGGTAAAGEAEQAAEAFSALRLLGKRVELRLYEGEDHGPVYWSQEAFKDLCASVLNWFDEHLGEQP